MVEAAADDNLLVIAIVYASEGNMFDKKVINHDDIIDEKVAKFQLYQTYYLIAYLPTHLKASECSSNGSCYL